MTAYCNVIPFDDTIACGILNLLGNLLANDILKLLPQERTLTGGDDLSFAINIEIPLGGIFMVQKHFSELHSILHTPTTQPAIPDFIHYTTDGIRVPICLLKTCRPRDAVEAVINSMVDETLHHQLMPVLLEGSIGSKASFLSPNLRIHRKGSIHSGGKLIKT